MLFSRTNQDLIASENPVSDDKENLSSEKQHSGQPEKTLKFTQVENNEILALQFQAELDNGESALQQTNFHEVSDEQD